MKKQFEFLRKLSENNNREWFAEHKTEYDKLNEENKRFFQRIYDRLSEKDNLTQFKVYRIYRDVRFKQDKTPYKQHFGAYFGRAKPYLRGGYGIHLEPNNSWIGGGFWNPNAEDLLRIRREFEMDTSHIKKVEQEEKFKEYFGVLEGKEGVKTAPKGFDKNHPAIDLIKKKQFMAIRNFTDEEVFSPNFEEECVQTLLTLRPFFDYMTDILSTDLNGEPLY